MPSTYSTSLRLELIGNGEQAGNWGNTNNVNLGTLLEQAIAGVESVAISGTSYTLTTGNGVSDQARNAVIVLTGTLAANCNVIVPTVDKTYTFRNATTGGFSVVVKTAAGSGVTIANGFTQSVYCDATNVVSANVPFNNATNTISGNVTGNVTGNLTGDVTGSASANVLKVGDTMTGALGVVAGTVLVPGLFVSGDTNTGIFQPAADTLAITVGGVEVGRFGANGLQSAAPWVDLASATTTDLGAQTTDNLRTTGTTTITGFGTAANGVTRDLRFAGALTLTHNATSLILPGGANIITAAGDTGTAKSLGSGNWVVTDFQRAAALPALQGLITGSGLTVATARVLGRLGAGSGAIEEIPIGNAAAALSLGINRGTEQATTTGTAVDLSTSIPAGVRRITIAFNGVSTNGTSAKLIQIGNASFVTSGYVSSGGAIATGSAGGSSSTQGFLVGNFSLAADAINGIMTLTNISGNGWVMSFSGGSSAGNFGAASGGFLSLGGALDRIRITTANGTDSFDAGAINIMWEF